jgi:hypothetical protein
MKGPYFKPWKGSNYESTRLLILSESAYSWKENGKRVDPGPTHPTRMVQWGIKHFGENKYHRDLGRALCGKRAPSLSELEAAWNDVAYTIFVQRTVGSSVEKRPNTTRFGEAHTPFLHLIEKIRPSKVVVTGKAMWKQMPACHGPHICDDLQAYKLSDGSLVWALAVPHPGNRQRGEGFVWERVEAAIRAFRSMKFPLRD